MGLVVVVVVVAVGVGRTTENIIHRTTADCLMANLCPNQSTSRRGPSTWVRREPILRSALGIGWSWSSKQRAVGVGHSIHIIFSRSSTTWIRQLTTKRRTSEDAGDTDTAYHTIYVCKD